MLREKIHNFIEIIGKYHGLIWLQVRMTYHQLTNLGVIVQGGLVSNIREVIEEKYFLNHECNCNPTTRVKVYVPMEVNV